MRVAVDATPLLDAGSGVPRYCSELLGALAALPGADAPDLVLVPFSLRGDLPAVDGARPSPRRAPARVLRALWARGDHPRVELLSGPCDVFHGTNFLSPPSRAAAVVTVHDLAFVQRPETVRPASLANERLLRRAVARGPLVVCTPSEAVREQVVDHYGLPPGDVVATPLAASEAWFATDAPVGPAPVGGAGLPADYLVFVGTDEPRKNLPVLLAAHRLARERDGHLPALVLVGGAGWGARTGEAASAPGVVRLGRLDDPALRAVVAGSRGVLLPSLDEGFGLPVLEAMACGRPVAVSDIPVMREVAGAEAVFAPPSDVEAWADALARLAALPDTPAARGRRRDHARAWSWRRCATRTVDAYRRAVLVGG